MRRIVQELDADILLFNAPVERPRDRRIINWLTSRKLRPNLFMILVTNGGDPDAAYRIARCIQNHYQKFTICVSGSCKSAGTLLLMGANELVFTDHGEIGPLDIQMAKKDELWGFESGLTVMTALSALYENAQDAFNHFLLSLTTGSGGRLTARTASEIAAKLTESLFSPLSEQIDPVHLGEINRSMAIAKEYGKRLLEKGKNADEDILRRLVGDYPSHGFVIDKEEAKTLFKSVRDCTDDERALMVDFENWSVWPASSPWVRFVSDDILEEDEENAKAAAATAGAQILEQPGADGAVPTAAGDVPPNGQPPVAGTDGVRN
ncbi:MAG TPA: hypothetical protein VEF06_06740 [Bryobacteraceae bacterium]|nr:hypothetical protein [Bryobacteraceae bacterium]